MQIINENLLELDVYHNDVKSDTCNDNLLPRGIS